MKDLAPGFVVVVLCIAGGLFLNGKIERLEATVSEMHRLESQFMNETVKHLTLIEQRERMRYDRSATLRSYGGR